MPRRFRKPTDEDCELLGEALNTHHPELIEAKVRVGLILVEPPFNSEGQVTGPAITVAGNRVAAQCRRLSAKARVYNDHDVEIDIDASIWSEMNKKHRLALLDHELEHVVLLDGLEPGGRPKLTLQPDDYATSGFVSVAERHGGDSFEVIHLKAMWEQAGPMLFPWAEHEDSPQSPGAPGQSPDQTERPSPDRKGGDDARHGAPLPDGRGSESRGSESRGSGKTRGSHKTGATKKGKAKVA